MRAPLARTKRPLAAASAPPSKGHHRQVEVEAEEHQHGPGRRTEGGQEVDDEDDPDHKRELSEIGHRHRG
jgi:hypothetical protein